ncbi:MAG: FkbM family methyltransferase [Alphaproteobacteria bacterium]|nr:FkbM family methyltransferase [Alphaproteobacteria bacterium]
MSKQAESSGFDANSASAALDDLIHCLPDIHAYHASTTHLHRLLSPIALQAAHALFRDPNMQSKSFSVFGDVVMPYVEMGKVDSVDILNLNELILFSFYWKNRHIYSHAADLGANIGWHSLLLSRVGYEVRAWEPDPGTFALLRRNLDANRCASVTPYCSAVSVHDGTARFVRVLGNLTSSHIEGSKTAPYGELEMFDVPLTAFSPIAAWADLVKIDIEGHEADLLCSTDASVWQATDALAEIGTHENAQRLFEHFNRIGVSIFSQKIGWQRVRSADDIPVHYSEGSVFISTKAAMPW